MKSLVSVLNKIKRFVKIVSGTALNQNVQISIPKERHGSSYGGWFICPRDITKNSIVYSFGIGEDISFDTSLIQAYGVTVHGFDPTPRSISWIKNQKLPDTFMMHEFGLSASDGLLELYPPSNRDHVSCSIVNTGNQGNNTLKVTVKKISSIMKELKHDRIDILKMDIEGSEYCVIDDLLSSRPNISQILVEFHHRFPKVGVKSTKDAIGKLNKHGYRIFAVSESQEEFSFIKIDTAAAD